MIKSFKIDTFEIVDISKFYYINQFEIGIEECADPDIIENNLIQHIIEFYALKFIPVDIKRFIRILPKHEIEFEIKQGLNYEKDNYYGLEMEKYIKLFENKIDLIYY